MNRKLSGNLLPIIPWLEETQHDEDIVKESKDSTLTQAGGEAGSSSMSLSLAFSIQWLDRLCGIVPSSSKGRMIYMLTMLSIPLLPILALITQNIVLLTDTIQRKTDLLDADRSVLKSDETARLISALQQVRRFWDKSLSLRWRCLVLAKILHSLH